MNTSAEIVEPSQRGSFWPVKALTIYAVIDAAASGYKKSSLPYPS
jgi:hypothetical protein